MPALDRSRRDQGFTLVELLIVIAIIGILAVIAIPGLMRSRLSANEASGIATMRSITSGQVAFASTCGGGGYASSLAVLALAPPNGQPFVPPDVTGGTKSGYTIALAAAAASNVVLAAADTCNGSSADTVSGYVATATPTAVGVTGQRSFATNTTGGIFQDMTGALIANPIPPGTQRLN